MSENLYAEFRLDRIDPQKPFLRTPAGRVLAYGELDAAANLSITLKGA